MDARPSSLVLLLLLLVVVLIGGVRGAFDCADRKDGVYPSVAGACTDVFWKCWNGEAFRYTCPSELFFREDADYCDYKEKVPNCGERPTDRADDDEPPGFDCDGRADGFYLRQQVNNRLFQCTAGHSSPLSVSVSADQ
ncbi:Chitin binding domain-containing protein [Aphelenchoides fujianensis]|nr:Chitin binding domain-containing protein [Aphelenchoides fujianensis]